MNLLVCGVLVHLLFLASIFDIYFNSPVLHGIKEFQPSFAPAAKRLVLFVADGLRANTFFSRKEYSPYLRSIIEERGSWGVSHTRVPTESRPGHVAMIAGLYEDPSAVTKGWKENPVEFDSVFNRSSHTWAWGSADILPMFAKGEAAGRVTTFTYPKSMQRFSGDGSNEKLDTWVFDRMKRFFFSASTKSDEKIGKKGVVLFLHLLGIDTAGHATKPHSYEYLSNIQLVDKGIQEIERAIEGYFNNDGKTVYVFTADHGMTDWGSHGAGLPDETETPLVLWGAGIKGPESPKKSQESPQQWDLSSFDRKDVNQADVAALMAALLAIPTPTNNVGILPTEYIGKDPDWIYLAAVSNMEQILLQLERAKDLVHDKVFSVFLVPYPHLEYLEKLHHRLTQNGSAKDLPEVKIVCDLALIGIEYYQNYFGASLKLAITAAHIFWMIFLITRLISKPRIEPRNSLVFDFVVVAVLVSSFVLIIAQKLPIQYFAYYSLPVLLLWLILRDVDLWWSQITSSFTKNNVLKLSMFLSLTILGISCLVASFFKRSVLSFALLALALWPPIEKLNGGKWHRNLVVLWTVICIAVAVFPLLPVIGKEANYFLVFLAGLLATPLSICALLMYCNSSKKLLLSQSVLVIFASINVIWNSENYDAGLGLTWINQITSWTIFGLSLIFPLIVDSSFVSKMLSLSLSICTCSILLSVRHEALFIVLLLILLVLYPLIELEVQTSDALKSVLHETLISNMNNERSGLSFTDIRRAFLYLFFTMLAFFGIGNIASLNSFDPAWVKAFVSTFDPFLMGALILIKTILPFFAVASSIASVSLLSKKPIQWLLVLSMCDAMALPFFHMVQTKGSWLDIGQSISHFVIAHVCILFLLLLHTAAHLFLVFNIRSCKNYKVN
ncbi:GPI ethanolamine phosphate transferase 1 [Cloeon dipterum]|uniref:GPI ethanolamine phosphate transferase 1 n=1 Tax=Cloeon dipterum TaxID=197152 RepID=UPI00321FFA96